MTLRPKIESINSFKSVILNDPIKLLAVIKEHSLCFEEHQYKLANMPDTIKNVINWKQKDKKGPLEHTRSKLAREVLKYLVDRPAVLDKCVK